MWASSLRVNIKETRYKRNPCPSFAHLSLEQKSRHHIRGRRNGIVDGDFRIAQNQTRGGPLDRGVDDEGGGIDVLDAQLTGFLEDGEQVDEGAADAHFDVGNGVVELRVLEIAFPQDALHAGVEV